MAVKTPPNFDRWLDVIENAEPLTTTRVIAIVTAVILGAIDQWLGVIDNPLLSGALAYAVLSLVTWGWDRAHVWSRRSVAREVESGTMTGEEILAGRDPK